MSKTIESLADTIMARAVEVAATATEADRQEIAGLLERAKAHAGNPVTDMVEWRPAMGAIMTTQFHPSNREWDPSWSSQLARMMIEGEWKPTSQGYALYDDGSGLGDGRHRLLAQAYCGVTLTMPTYLGLSRNSIGALDCGKKRTIGDAAALMGIVNAKAKAILLQTVWSYERKAGITVEVQEANISAAAAAIQAADRLLTRAIELGQVAYGEVTDPVLSEVLGGRVCALLMRGGWPEGRIIENLDKIQSEDFENDKSPLAVARRIIEERRAPKDVISGNAEVAVVIKGMEFAEHRATITRKGEGEILNAAKHFPSPGYPTHGGLRLAAD
jgi:hypothetical protein